MKEEFRQRFLSAHSSGLSLCLRLYSQWPCRHLHFTDDGAEARDVESAGPEGRGRNLGWDRGPGSLTPEPRPSPPAAWPGECRLLVVCHCSARHIKRSGRVTVAPL